MSKTPLAVHPRRSESVLWRTRWLCYKTEATTSASHDSAGTGRGDLRPVSKVRHNFSQGRIDDRDLRAQSNHLVKFNYVIRAHSHATITDWQSQVSFFRCSVYVDIAAEGIRVLRLSPTQPNNAANDG